MNIFSELPQEVVLGIFKHLDKTSLCQVNAVSRDMHNLTSDVTLWTAFIQESFPQATIKKGGREEFIKLAHDQQQFYERWANFILNNLQFPLLKYTKMRLSSDALTRAHIEAKTLAMLYQIGYSVPNELQIIHQSIPVHRKVYLR